VRTGQYIEIVGKNKTDIPYCAIPNDDQGAQIGPVNGDEKHQVYEY